MPIPYRLVTPRLVLRCFEPSDAAALKAAIDHSLEHLRPWMPWAETEPESLEAKAQRLRGMRGRFDLDQDYTYGIFLASGECIGGSGLHPRVEPTGREIGYWIANGHQGRGYITEAAAALTRAAFQLCGARRVEIAMEPDNLRSAAVPRRLGFLEEGVLRCRMERAGGRLVDRLTFSMLEEDFPDSACARAPVEAYDVLGRPISFPP